MKKGAIYLLVSVLVISLILPGCSGNKKQPADAQSGQLVFRSGTGGTVTLPSVMAAMKFNDLVAQKSNGSMKIDFYPDRQLGGDSELLELVMAGTLDMANIAASALSTYTPLMESLQVPFLLNTYAKEEQAANSQEMKDIFKALEAQNIKVLFLTENGLRHFANNVRPINTPADLKGLKLRVVPSNLIQDSIKALGANPTPMAYGEVYTALQSKVIDGEEINLTSIYSEKHYEVLKYVSKIGLWPFPSVVIMNLNTYNKLSTEQKKILEEAAAEGQKYNFTLFQQAEAKATDAMTKAGVEINEIQDMKPFIDVTSSTYATWAAKDPLIQKFIEKAKTFK